MEMKNKYDIGHQWLGEPSASWANTCKAINFRQKVIEDFSTMCCVLTKNLIGKKLMGKIITYWSTDYSIFVFYGHSDIL